MTGRRDSRTTGDAEIRGVRPQDLPPVLDLLRASGLPTAGVAEHFAAFLVATDSGSVCGVAGLEIHGRDGVLRSLAVRPSRRGRGIGGRLTERVIAAARDAGLRRVYLLTTTAEGYFPRHGFRPIARDRVSEAARRSIEFREACPESAAAMVLELD